MLTTTPKVIHFEASQSEEMRQLAIKELSPEERDAVMAILIPYIVEEGFGELDPEDKKLERLLSTQSAGFVLSSDWRLRVFSGDSNLPASDGQAKLYEFVGWPGDSETGACLFKKAGSDGVIICDIAGGEVEAAGDVEAAADEYAAVVEIYRSLAGNGAREPLRVDALSENAKIVYALLASIPKIVHFGLDQSNDERLRMLKAISAEERAATHDILVRHIASQMFGDPIEKQPLETLMAVDRVEESAGEECVASDDWCLRVFTKDGARLYEFVGWPGDNVCGAAVLYRSSTDPKVDVYVCSDGHMESLSTEFDKVVADYEEQHDLDAIYYPEVIEAQREVNA